MYTEGLVLEKGTMKTVRLLDGGYDWTNVAHRVKKGALLTWEGSDFIAGSPPTLIECDRDVWA